MSEELNRQTAIFKSRFALILTAATFAICAVLLIAAYDASDTDLTAWKLLLAVYAFLGSAYGFFRVRVHAASIPIGQ